MSTTFFISLTTQLSNGGVEDFPQQAWRSSRLKFGQEQKLACCLLFSSDHLWAWRTKMHDAWILPLGLKKNIWPRLLEEGRKEDYFPFLRCICYFIFFTSETICCFWSPSGAGWVKQWVDINDSAFLNCVSSASSSVWPYWEASWSKGRTAADVPGSTFCVDKDLRISAVFKDIGEAEEFVGGERFPRNCFRNNKKEERRKIVTVNSVWQPCEPICPFSWRIE